MLLQVSDLSVRYGVIEAVRGLSLTVAKGEIVALLGANGAGKSSTLSAIVGLAPATGTILFDQHECSQLDTEQRVRAGLGLTPEGRRVFSKLTVMENLTLGAASRRADRNGVQRSREQAFSLFPVLAERRYQLAGTLSGGQQQQLAIARALMAAPKLLLLDEPSLGLAPRIVEDIFALLARLRTEGLTMLLVEQNVSQALALADRGYVLANGSLVMSGSASELADTQTLTQAYLGNAHD